VRTLTNPLHGWHSLKELDQHATVAQAVKLKSERTCDDDDADACVGAVPDGASDLRPWWVTQPGQAQEHHATLNVSVLGGILQAPAQHGF
jgi:hypothetical protein